MEIVKAVSNKTAHCKNQVINAEQYESHEKRKSMIPDAVMWDHYYYALMRIKKQ